MGLFLVALVALLGLTAWFVLSPLWRGVREEPEEAATAPRGRRLSAARRETARRELLWRLEHDRQAGRLSEADYAAALEAAAAAGGESRRD